MAQLFRKKTIIFAQGIGPINNRFLKRITACILRKTTYVTVRDDKSLNTVLSWNIKAEKSKDPVWNIKIPSCKKNNKIGIQLRDHFQLTDNFIEELAIAINNNFQDKEINIISLQNKLDINICNKLKNKLLKLNKNLNVQVTENSSNEKIISDINELEAIIAMRYHACLIALKCNVKLLPINYDIKVEELAKEFNIETLNLNNTENIQEKIKIFKEISQADNSAKIENFAFNFEDLEKIIN